jgi:hypothetical protein
MLGVALSYFHPMQVASPKTVLLPRIDLLDRILRFAAVTTATSQMSMD